MQSGTRPRPASGNRRFMCALGSLRLASRASQPVFRHCARRARRNPCSWSEPGLPESPFRIGAFLIETPFRSEFVLSYRKQTSATSSNRNSSHRLARTPSSLPQHPFAALAAVACYTGPAAMPTPTRGKFIVLEGIDGSGKRTQLDLLANALSQRDLTFSRVSFPNYSGFFGKMVGRFLNGEFGSLAQVDPHFSALLYAGDRLESKPELDGSLLAGEILLADRYIASNLAHQGARMPPEKRQEFLTWLRDLEYRVYALPAEDLVIYLRVPVAEAHRLVAEKSARDYTQKKRDLQEADVVHLEAAAGVYDELAKQKNWFTIDCFDATTRALRAPEVIHKQILAAIDALVVPALRAHQ